MKYLIYITATLFGLSLTTMVYGQDSNGNEASSPAQQSLELKDYAVQIAGTSTIHAWTTQVNNIKGNLIMTEESIPQEVELEFEVATMESGRGQVMNDKIKKALSNDTHPWIKFKSTQIKSEGDHLSVLGDLNIGGVVKPISIEVEPNGQQYTTTVDLTFSLFEIEPPSAMFGQIKCGDEITITFDLTF